MQPKVLEILVYLFKHLAWIDERYCFSEVMKHNDPNQIQLTTGLYTVQYIP